MENDFEFAKKLAMVLDLKVSEAIEEVPDGTDEIELVTELIRCPQFIAAALKEAEEQVVL